MNRVGVYFTDSMQLMLMQFAPHWYPTAPPTPLGKAFNCFALFSYHL